MTDRLETDVAQAYVYLQHHQWQQAVELFESILAYAPNCAKAYSGLGLAFVMKNQFLQARDHFHSAINIENNNPVYHHHLGKCLRHLGELEQALHHCQIALQLKPDYAEALNSLGNLYFDRALYKEACQFYHYAISILPNYEDAYFNLGQSAMAIENLELAEIAWDYLLANAPTRTNSALLGLGNIAFARQQYEQAIRYYKKLLELQTNHLEAKRNLAWSYIETNQTALALQLCDEILKTEPHDSQVLFNKGVVLMQLQRWQEALETFQKLSDLDKPMLEAKINLAAIYLRLQQPEVALRYYQDILKLQPDNEIANYMIAALTGSQPLTEAPASFITQLYDNYAPNYERSMIADLDYQVPKLMLDLLQKTLPAANRKLVVNDLGCGTGLLGEQLRHFARELIGVDISEKSLRYAAGKNIYTKLWCGPMLQYLQELARDVDLIAAGDSLLYSGDLSALFAAAYAALTPGGYFIFSVELHSGQENYFLEKSGRFSHSQNYVTQLSEKNNFKISALENVNLRSQQNYQVKGLIVLLQK